MVQVGPRAALLGSLGGGTGDLLFLPFCVLANLPLVLGGMVMYLGLEVEELFASFSIPIEAAISASIPPQIDYLFHPPHLHRRGFLNTYLPEVGWG